MVSDIAREQDSSRTIQSPTWNLSHPEHDAVGKTNQHGDFQHAALLDLAALKGKSNAPARADTMQSLQRMHGNRSVQRYIGRSTGGSAHAGLPVQRQEREPTLPELEQGVRQAHSATLDAEGDLNAIMAVPALGNVVAAGASFLNLGTAGLHAAFGDDDLADASLSNAGHRAMQALPFLGNYLAGRDASRDYDASEAALIPPHPLDAQTHKEPEAAQDRFRQQSLWDYIWD